ncbi:B-cell receptor-associated protein 29-like isoform X2 [Kryptolebias marmoratus]|uniref:Endoplasmic reticulum transmembrane protein n=1 Tax=Kryptolebias marmoratus TaxID=37003 RepID=A0A3Q3A028_KRYMA|nr:B-cell receptor-associated protein 29-like isoform X2 [Kryptolebias marmoratus]
MTVQWMAVAFFLYAEVAIILILCIPFISAQRWCLIFSWRVWSWLSSYWNKFFFAMVMALIVLFIDAFREVQKYSNLEPMLDTKANPNLYDHVHMKLFRAQRNFYICGFSLFLWLIMRRVVTLLNQVAATLEDTTGLQAQADKALETAKKQQGENQELKKALLEGEKSTSSAKQQLRLEIEKMESQLRVAEEAVRKSQAEVKAMTSQFKGLAQEYDRLLREHNQLENLYRSEDKKDQ